MSNKPLNNSFCIYCTVPFGSIVYWHKKERMLVRHRDHFIPASKMGSPYESRDPKFLRGKNEMWSCQICNHIKHDKLFDSFAEAQNYILDKLLNSDWELRHNPLD